MMCAKLAAELPHFAKRVRVQQEDGAALASRGNPAAVRAEGHVKHELGVRG
jgi:hypothetical protein